ncbi:MAG: DUF433 domain-containing protein [Rectinemataceae bacterium]|jgi:uncharacterized protein (DUF433 family)
MERLHKRLVVIAIVKNAGPPRRLDGGKNLRRQDLLKIYSHNGIITMSFAKERVVGQFDRITQEPDVMGGRACIRGMRVTVGMIVNQIGAGRSVDDLLAEYPYLEREDIMQALRYAAWRSEEREVLLGTG